MQIDYLKISDDGKNVISCDNNANGRIIVPEGVEKIKNKAFFNCIDIFEIVLPQSLNEIDSYAFKGCVNLHLVNIPNNVKEISYECFCGCINLSSIKLPSNIKKISSKAFYNCENLKDITFPESLERIDSASFYGCSNIFQLVIPESTYCISDGAFENCNNLAILAIKSKRTSISPTAFKGCMRLARLYLANFNTNLAISSFGDCVNLNIISPISDFDIIKSNNSVSYQQIHKEHANNLKYMCLYYKLFGMNLTQMKWCESLKYIKSFKEPINSLWEDYKTKEQPLNEILALDWNYSAGIGLILGYNNFRALDFDIDSDFMFQVMGRTIDEFINEILDLLQLPLDYQWVVRSGNGYGFHIIFKCNNFSSTKNLDSISFAPSDEYDNYGQSLFNRIELRWCDHLVLPPSIHASGNNYYFRNNTIPNCQPNEIKLSLIDTMLCKYCGDFSVRSFSYQNRSFNISELKKITSRHDSYLSPHEHNIDSIEYLNDAFTPECVNSLAIKYLIGDDVDADTNKALRLFKSSNTQNSIFNLLSLYSVGFYQCSISEFNKLLDSLDKEQFIDYISQLKENASKYINKSDLFLFFDTETNGLPLNYDASPNDVNNWPRIIQIAWIITDDAGLILKKGNYIIKPIGFTISPESTSVHGISTQYAMDHGEDISFVLTEFATDLNLCKYIIGHNIQFDKNVMTAEMCRLKRKINWDTKKCICTMKSTIEYCKIPSKSWYHSGYSYPKLEELHIKLFGKSFENAHDAFSDITATSRCFWELKRVGFFNDYFKSDKDDDLPF